MTAKIARPILSGIVQRHRLYTLLDQGAGKPVTWLSAPGGSGKSTLVAGYLDTRKRPCIWYHCDEGDADLATFFYYMGLAAKKAAPRYRKPLPLLTPEYLGNIPTFTRRYFEQLYVRATTIVLDNYQDLPADAPFHDMLATGLDGIPAGIRVIVLSRGNPPTVLTRLRANDRIHQLHSTDIRFTLDESTELVTDRLPTLGHESIKVIHEQSQGWATGIILMLERAVIDRAVNEPPMDSAYGGVFDYFAEEIFNRIEKELRLFLLKTAFLPVLSPAQAVMLTGIDSAGRILSTFNRHHLFTERLSGSTQNFHYHPLFRTFLMNRAKRTFAPDELGDIQRESALLLEQSGHLEDAARLYCDIGDRDGLSRLVVQHARELLRQGRSKTVEEWIACIPGEPEDHDPWLSYWAGICSFPMDLPRTRIYLEKAFASFKEKNDPSGFYLAWAGIVDSYVFGDGWKNLDDCIAIFDELWKTFPSFPSQEVDLTVSSRMFIALTLRKTDQPQRVQGWLERVSLLLLQNPSFDIQMDTVFGMSVYYLWKGEYSRNAVLLERAEAEIRQHRASPFAVIRIKLMKGIHFWISAEYQAAVKILGEALETSAQSGVHVYDPLLWGFKAAAEMAPGNLELAEISLKNQMASLLGMKNALNTYFYHINAAWYALLTGNPTRAAVHMETIATSTQNMGTPYYQALWNIGMAQVAFLQGDAKEAVTLVRTAHRISLNMKSHVMEWYSQLVEAYFLLREGTEEEGLALLGRSLSLGRKHDYVHLEFYQPAAMRFLFTKALEQGIEPDYVTRLIRKLALTPQQPLEQWPSPIRIYTLGRFQIIRDDEPLKFSGKVPKKPLELLKVLIAYGGWNVPVDTIAGALWPEADGDASYASFKVALHSLRKLLGSDEAIVTAQGGISLNSLHCRVDAPEFQRCADEVLKKWNGASASDQQRSLVRAEKAIEMYSGNFLPDDAGLIAGAAMRERLRSRFVRLVELAGQQYREQQKWHQAIELYETGIDTDELQEEFYVGLMHCYSGLGRHGAAAAVYERCRRMLHTHFNVVPSTAMKNLHEELTILR